MHVEISLQGGLRFLSDDSQRQKELLKTDEMSNCLKTFSIDLTNRKYL